MTDMELAEEIRDKKADACPNVALTPEECDQIIAALRRADLAQTEIKGHMRNESDLLNELALARADWACAQARIAELEKVLAIYADSKNFVEGNDWYWVGDDDPTLAAKKALKSSA